VPSHNYSVVMETFAKNTLISPSSESLCELVSCFTAKLGRQVHYFRIESVRDEGLVRHVANTSCSIYTQYIEHELPFCRLCGKCKFLLLHHSPAIHMLRSISVSESPSRTHKVFAAASGRVYHKQFADADCDWSYSGHKGVVMFGKGRNDADNRLSAASVVHGSVDPDGYWFRLTDGGRTTWRFPVPVMFDYKVDKPFFHIFSGSVSRNSFTCAAFRPS
jgi:hypothetical protein